MRIKHEMREVKYLGWKHFEVLERTYQSCQEVNLQNLMLKRTSGPWEKSLFCRGLTISQEGGPIWKKILHTYDAKVPNSQSILGVNVEKDVSSRGLTS